MMEFTESEYTSLIHCLENGAFCPHGRDVETCEQCQDAIVAVLRLAPELLAALEAEQEWREREEAGALDPDWDYEVMVGAKRRAAIAKAEGTP